MQADKFSSSEVLGLKPSGGPIFLITNPQRGIMIIVSNSWDGQMRKLSSHYCLQCGKEFFAPLKAEAKYCCKKCNGLHKRTRITVSCSKCGKQFERQLNKAKELNYCSRECKELDQRVGGPLSLPHYIDGSRWYRARALRDHGKKCNRCGYEEHERMLDVHHKDGDRSNGRIDNLEVLCVWCHALYTRKVLGPSPNWDGISPARRNNIGSNPIGSTNFIAE